MQIEDTLCQRFIRFPPVMIIAEPANTALQSDPRLLALSKIAGILALGFDLQCGSLARAAERQAVRQLTITAVLLQSLLIATHTENRAMGYTVVAYLVPLERLRALYGSNDPTILSNIEARLPEDFAALDLWWEEEIWFEGEEKPADHPAIRSIIQANLAGIFPWDVAPYRAILELFCRYLGTELPNDMFDGLRPAGVDFVSHEEHQMGDVVFRSPAPVAIPRIEDETMYRAGHVTSETAAMMLAQRDPYRWQHLTDDEQWEQRAADQFYGWLEAAVQTNQALVTFFK